MNIFISVMWNWGGFASAICRAAPGPQAPVAADVTMSWVSIVPCFLWRALPVLVLFAARDPESAHLEDLR